MGADFSAVRVHVDAESTDEIGADAYTVGEQVVFAPGRYAPATAGGLRLLTHELTHVLQQRAGAAAAVRRQPAAPTTTATPTTATPTTATPTLAPPPAGALDRVGTCLTQVCEPLDTGGAERTACASSPQPCGQRWRDATIACLERAGDIRDQTRILVNERTELPAELMALDDWYAGGSRDPVRPTAATYLDRLYKLCRLKRGEILAQLRFGVVFTGAPQWRHVSGSGQVGELRAWGGAGADERIWDEISAALATVPLEHLRDVTIHRQNRGDRGAAMTNQATREITVFDTGLGASPTSRSTGIPGGLPWTYQALRHEVGHVVERWHAGSAVQLDLAREMGWEWYVLDATVPNPVSMPTCPAAGAATPTPAAGAPTLTVTNALTRPRLCQDAGFRTVPPAPPGPAGPGPSGPAPAPTCDDAGLDAFLVLLRAAPQTRNGRCFGYWDNFINSWPTGAVPNGPEFAYARTSMTDFIAETYAFATSVPEWLHTQVSPAVLTFFKQRVFETQRHLDEIRPRLEAFRTAFPSHPAARARAEQIIGRAPQQFTRGQLEGLAGALDLLLLDTLRPDQPIG